MSERTLFDEIVAGNIPSWKIWEDEHYLAFLSPFGNTPGMTVVVPKVNPGAHIFAVDLETAHGLIDAATTVAKLLEKALGTDRVAMVFEGEAVPHVHAKLYPMHGFDDDRADFPKQQVFFPRYPGYITSADGPRLSDDELTALQQKIRKVVA